MSYFVQGSVLYARGKGCARERKAWERNREGRVIRSLIVLELTKDVRNTCSTSAIFFSPSSFISWYAVALPSTPAPMTITSNTPSAMFATISDSSRYTIYNNGWRYIARCYMHIVVACTVVANAICVIVHNFLSTLCNIFTPARSLYVFLQSFCQLDS